MMAHVYIPLSGRASELVRAHESAFGSRSDLVRTVLRHAYLRGVTPSAEFEPNWTERLSVQIPEELAAPGPRALGALIETELSEYATGREKSVPRTADGFRAVDVEIPGELSGLTRLQAFAERKTLQEYESELVWSALNESMAMLGQMGGGYEIHSVRVPTQWWPQFRRMCRATDQRPDDVLTYHLALKVLRGRIV